MPRWDIYDVASVIGADPKRMRSYAVQYPAMFRLADGRFITAKEGINELLKHGREFGVDPIAAYDAWHEHPAAPAGAPPSPGTRRASGAAPAGPDQATVAALAELTAIVAAQQQQIAQLQAQLLMATVARIHEDSSRRSSEHLQHALTRSAAALKDLGVPAGEVSVGTVRHKGSLSLRMASDGSTSSDVSEEAALSSKLGGEIAAELAGLKGKLAKISTTAKGSLEKIDSRTKRAKQAAQQSSSTEASGDFEMEYAGISIRISGSGAS